MDGNWINDLVAAGQNRPNAAITSKNVRERSNLDVVSLNPCIKVIDIVVDQPDMADTRGDLERLLLAVRERCDLSPRVGLSVMTKLQSTLRSSLWRVEAREVGLPIHRLAQIHFLPAIASHVGADAAAVVLNQSPHAAEAMTLIVDIGTNAETFLCYRDGVVTTSCPTGPAFEGAVISHGQRAAVGAIETIRIDPVTKQIRLKVIGSEVWSDDPQFETSIEDFGVSGICGSGVIEMVAEMRMAGIIDETGRMGNQSGILLLTGQ